MDNFFHVAHYDKTYGIECQITVYRALLGKHPDFLKAYEGDRYGYNTKFYLLIEDCIEDEAAAEEKCQELNRKYSDLIIRCEETGNWDDFPFKDKEVVYYK